MLCVRVPRCCSDSWPGICTEYALELCPLIEEACCLPDGRCGMTDRRTCELEGGVPQGAGSDCSTRCPLPPEACCFSDGGCSDRDPEICETQGGLRQGPGTSCTSVTCPIPPEACCLRDGTCVEITPLGCQLRGGVPQGPGTDCESATCPLPPEACCIDGQCAEVDPRDCRLQGGTPLGPGSGCLGDGDQNGNDDACDPNAPCDVCGPGPHWIHQPNCPPGADNLPSGAKFGIDLDLDCVADVSVVANGPATILRSGAVDDSLRFPGTRPVDGHLDVIDTEIVSMHLTNSSAGVSLLAGAGLGVIPLPPSFGAMAEQPATPELADSFFEVFFEVQVNGALLYNQTALRVNSKIDCLPPDTDYIHPVGCLPLFTSPSGPGTAPVANLVTARHGTFLTCGSATAGDCFLPNGTPYCDDEACCHSVCEQEPDCCGVEWDDTCAGIATEVCPQPEACCLSDGRCAVVMPDDCLARNGVPLGPRTRCEGDADFNRIDDACEPDDQCEDCGPGEHWIDQCPGGNDNMSTGAKIGIDLNLDCEPDVSMVLSGPVSVWRSNPLEDSTQFPGLSPSAGHLDVIDTEIVSMVLSSSSTGVTLRAGQGMGLGGMLPSSFGAIVEQVGAASMGDSFFEVFFEVDVGGGRLAYNHDPLRVDSKIDCLPPDATYIHPVGCIPLYDVPSDSKAIPQLVANLVTADHSTFPDCGDGTTGDCFIPNSTPFCDDAECCERICAVLPHCCDIGWDVGCADAAREICRPAEACCLRDATCTEEEAQTCREEGGMPQGFGTTCQDVTCPLPPEACCLPDGNCDDLSHDGCLANGGLPLGPGTACEGDANNSGIDDACETDPQCEDCGPGDHWIDQCAGGNDNMSTGAKVGIDLDFDCLPDMSMVLNGPVSVWRSNPQDDSTRFPGLRPIDRHRDVIETEIVSMSLTNAAAGVTITAGAGMGQFGNLRPSFGAIAEQPGDPALADSFFEMFVEVDVQGLVAFNTTPLRVETKIDCLPPDATYIHPVGCIELYDGTGNHVGNLVTADHSTYPECGDPTTGDCLEPNGTPFCDDLRCCELVCEQLPLCCEEGWDPNCADLAERFCQECPGVTIVRSIPPNGVVDARQPSDVLNSLPRLGIGTQAEPIIIVLDPPAPGAEGCFNLCETRPDRLAGPNAIQTVTYLGNGEYQIILRHAITPDAVTTIQYKGDGSFVEFTSHPANVNADSMSAPSDILKVIDYINGVGDPPPWGIYSEDVDRSNMLGPPDILRVIDLLNGAGAFDSWLNTPLPVNTTCPLGG